MKVIAYYLPQYHRTDENDKWWGDGFTEWTNMKSAKPLFTGHYQPRIPYKQNYYNLLDNSVLKWQIDLAKEYGVYGFCFYHYWSEQGMLLNKPIENFLYNKELDFPFCFCWANETWTKAWTTKTGKPEVIWEQTYGEQKEWKRHFEYLLPFFKDPRYIKENGKPLFVIYRPERIKKLNEMLAYLNDLAVKEGFGGIVFASQQTEFIFNKVDDSMFDYKIEYQPNVGEYISDSFLRRKIDNIKKKLILFSENYLKVSIPRIRKLVHIDYDVVWNAILERKPDSDKLIPGAFVDWDNTPRYKDKGKVYDGATPEKFFSYFKQQIIHAKKDYHKDMIFIFAWNEWSEGGYLEPDEKNKLGYLEAVKKALIETNEWENIL